LNLILDTHIFLWAIATPEKLTQRQRGEIEQPTNRLFLSAISVAELMIKASLGKLTLTFDPKEAALASGIETLPFTAEDASRLGRFLSTIVILLTECSSPKRNRSVMY